MADDIFVEKWCSVCDKLSWDSMVGSYGEHHMVKGKRVPCNTNGRVMKTDNNGNEVIE